MLKSRFANAILLAILPISYLFSYIKVGNQKGPFWWGINQDPDYAYLLSSLSIVTSKPIVHTDHPGTPLQVLGAIVIKLYLTVKLGFNASVESTIQEVLRNPDRYLQAINYTLLVLTTGCFLLVGFVSFQICKTLLLSLTLQTTPFLMSEITLMNESSRVAPEVLLICIGQFLVLLAIAYIYRENIERSRWFAIAIGIVFGVGMAVKVTFMPLVLFFLLIPGIRGKIVALVAAIVAFVAATLPIVHRYPEILDWLVQVLTHSGRYGKGSVSLLDDNPIEDFSHLVSLSQIFFTLLVAATCIEIAFFLFKQWQSRYKRSAVVHQTDLQLKKLYFVSILITVAMWMQVVLGIKGHAQVRYLTPSASLCGLLIVTLLLLGLTLFSSLSDRLPERAFAVAFVSLVVCIGISIQQIHASSRTLAARYKVQSAEVASIQEIVQNDPAYHNCIQVKAKRAFSVDAALFFGDSWTGRNFSVPLSQIYPKAIFYVPTIHRYVSFRARQNLPKLLELGRGCVLFQSSPRVAKSEQLSSNMRLEDILVGKTQALYRILPPQ